MSHISHEDDWFITTLQISDSLFPTGTYSVSYGLETFALLKWVSRSEALQELVENYIKFQVGPSDCVAISNAYKASVEHDLKLVLEVDEKLYAMKLVKEFRECSTRIGRNFLETTVQFSPTRFINDFMMAIVEGRTPGNYAVSFGIASQSFNIPLKNALQAMLYSFTVGMMGAAMRLGITNHTKAQETIHSLKPTIRRMVGENMDKQVSSMYAFVPMIDIAGMIHQRLENRMFMS